MTSETTVESLSFGEFFRTCDDSDVYMLSHRRAWPLLLSEKEIDAGNCSVLCVSGSRRFTSRVYPF